MIVDVIALNYTRDEIEKHRTLLKQAREEFDSINENNSFQQVLISRKIADICTRIDALERLFTKLGGHRE